MNWDSFKKFDDFKKWVEKQKQNVFSFKIGVFNLNRENFDGLGYLFHKYFPEAPESKTDAPVVTPIGILHFRGLDLESKFIFAKPGTKVRQGDIFEYQENLLISPKPSHFIVLTHSCDLEHKPFAILSPGYRQSLLASYADQLSISKSNLGNIAQNKTVRHLSLPAMDPWGDENLIFDLSQVYSVNSKDLQPSKVILSLTYVGNAYLQNRFAISLFRDVKDSDDERKL